MNMKRAIFWSLTIAGMALVPTLGFCSVESSLGNVQNKVNFFLPILATLGLAWAGISFLTGNPNARSHLILAIIGAVVGFGASSIMSLIQQTIH